MVAQGGEARTQFVTFYLDTVTQMIYVAQYFAQLDLDGSAPARGEARAGPLCIASWTRAAVPVGVGARRGAVSVPVMPSHVPRVEGVIVPAVAVLAIERRAVPVRGGRGAPLVLLSWPSFGWRPWSNRDGLVSSGAPAWWRARLRFMVSLTMREPHRSMFGPA